MTFKDRVKIAAANKPLTYALAGIVVIAIILYFVFRAGRKAGAGVVAKYPTGGGVSPQWVKDQAPGVILELHDAVGWLVGLTTKQLAIESLSKLDDSQLVYVYNTYNQQYHAGSTESLYSDVDDMYQLPGFRDAKRNVLARMAALGMK